MTALYRTMVWAIAVASFSIGHAQPNAPSDALRMMEKGRTQPYSTTGRPKVKDASFTFRYPKNWTVSAGKSDDWVNTILFDGGAATISVMIMAQTVRGVDPKDAEFFAKDNIITLMPSSASYLGHSGTSVRDLMEKVDYPAGILEYRLRRKVSGMDALTSAMTVNFIQKNTLVIIAFNVTTIGDHEDTADIYYAKWKPVFEAIAGTILLY